MPWLWIFASAESDWGSRGEALCARVPQERLGALLLFQILLKLSMVAELDGRVDLAAPVILTWPIYLLHSKSINKGDRHDSTKPIPTFTPYGRSWTDSPKQTVSIVEPKAKTCFPRRPVDSAPCLSMAFGTVTSRRTDCADHMSVGRTLPQFDHPPRVETLKMAAPPNPSGLGSGPSKLPTTQTAPTVGA